MKNTPDCLFSRLRAICFAAALLASATAAVATPLEQQAVVQVGNGGPEVLHLQTVPVLEPGRGQVLIRVYAAGVNPIDYKLRDGKGPYGPPPGAAPVSRIPGLDVAGAVEAIGDGVRGLAPGDGVFAMIGRVQVDGLNGGYAQFVVAPADNVVLKPATLTFAEAAGLGTVGMTAARALGLAEIQPAQRVFIDGIAGGVGSTAAQIARAHGAIVIGTASARHHAFLASIGVDQVVDYTKADFEDVIEPVDVVLETVDAENAARAVSIVRPGGYLVSIVGPPPADRCATAGIRCVGIAGPAAAGPSEGDYLRQVAKLAARGRLSVHIDATYPLEQAAEAQVKLAERHTQGKIVLLVDPWRAGTR